MGEIHTVEFKDKKEVRRKKRNTLSFNMQALSLTPVDPSSLDEIARRTTLYFSGCAEKDIKPGVQGLCLWLGIRRETWYDWCRGAERRETHYEFCNRVMGLLAANWESNMQDNKTNAVSGIFIGKNDYGYKDKSEIEIEPKKTVVQETNMSDVIALLEDEKYIEASYTDIND